MKSFQQIIRNLLKEVLRPVLWSIYSSLDPGACHFCCLHRAYGKGSLAHLRMSRV